MRDTFRGTTRHAWAGLGVGVVLGALVACTDGNPAGELAAIVRARFPQHADRVLGAGDEAAFVAAPADAGFVPAPPAQADPVGAAEAALAAHGGLQASFPARGDGPVRLRLADGFTIEIREEGLAAAGRLERGAVAYPRGRDTGSLWTTTVAGYEEWLLVRAPAAGASVATWTVTGGTLRRRGDAVEVRDARGATRLTVLARVAFAADGAPVRPRLGVAGTRLTLALEGPRPGSLVLVDPAWVVPCDLTTARSSHTTTLLPSGKVLVVGGYAPDGTLRSAELYDPATRRFTPAGLLQTARLNHTATLLPSGEVLIAGGWEGGVGNPAAAELYDPAAGTFVATGVLQTPRSRHTATLLASGKVLLVGGSVVGSTAPLGTLELYDPATRGFVAAGALATPRYLHTATLLRSGKVLVVGGLIPGTGDLATVEVYDPATGGVTPGSSLATARSEHTATLLPSGKVLITGGIGAAGILATSERYDPTTGGVVPTGSLATGRSGHQAVLLPSGRVEVSGGRSASGADLASVEQYDPGSGAFVGAEPLATARRGHRATLLASGSVLVVGGIASSAYLASAELHDPGAAVMAPGGTMWTARAYHTATLLPSGKVLLAGGEGDPWVGLASAEEYDPATQSTTVTGPLLTARQSHTATLLPSGQVLLAGGGIDMDAIASAELYDSATRSFAGTGALATARFEHTATLLPSGKVLLVGGIGSNQSVLKSAEVYDPATGEFAAVGDLYSARRWHTATLLATGRVLICGGAGLNGMPQAVELYDPDTQSFTLAADVGNPRRSHTATLLPGGRVLVTGGRPQSGYPYLVAPEVYEGGVFGVSSLSPTARFSHTATLLPSGRVLLVGGSGAQNYLASTELIPPDVSDFLATAPLATGREEHTATLLPSGQVLLAGGFGNAGFLATLELYDEGRGQQAAWTPTLAGPLGTALPGDTLTLEGTLFTGVSEAGGGAAQSSATNHPLVLLQRQDNEALVFVPPSAWTATSATVRLPDTLAPGPYWVWVTVNGVLAEAQPLTVVKLPSGAACTAGFQCASSHCVDAVCCGSPCDAACMACDLSGQEGSCAPLPVFAEDPGPGATCVAPNACDGAGSCKLGTGSTCAQATQCASGYCANGVCCATPCDGVCQVCGAGGLCGGCASDRFCDGTGCVPKLTLGGVCTADNECQTDFCADGRCCVTACLGNCEQCNVPGHVGECWPVADGTDPKGGCQASVGGHPACAGKCHARQCAFPDLGTTCGLCSACDGTGRCTVAPDDDDACGTVDCSGLDTACRAYQDLTTGRCAALGTCKAANDPETCTAYADLPCADGGEPVDGGAGDGAPVGADGGGAGADGGDSPPGSAGCACRTRGGRSPRWGLALVLVLGVARRRRPRAPRRAFARPRFG